MDPDYDRPRTGPLDPHEMKQILAAALQRSEDASERMIKLFDSLFSRKSRWEHLEAFTEDDLNEIWALLRHASEQSYRADRRLHELLDDFKNLIERLHVKRSLMESDILSMSSAEPAVSHMRIASEKFSLPASPREFILGQLRAAGDAGLEMRPLYLHFMALFATRSVKPEGLWATTISRMLKAGEIRQEDRDEGRWYFLRSVDI